MPKHISPRFLAQVQVSIANRLRQCSDAIRRLSILARDDDCFGTILRNGRIRHRQSARKSTTSELQSLMPISYAVFCFLNTTITSSYHNLQFPLFSYLLLSPSLH